MMADESESSGPLRDCDVPVQISKSPDIRQPGVLRKLPIVCFFIALAYLLIGRLRFPKRFLSRSFDLDEGQTFTVFRNMRLKTNCESEPNGFAVLAVKFRFARFKHETNRRLSLIPIPLIAGFPGFREKMWMVNEKTSEWLGLYQWESEQHAKAYKNSFVLRLMTRRASGGSVSMQIVPKISISDYLTNINSLNDDFAQNVNNRGETNG